MYFSLRPFILAVCRSRISSSSSSSLKYTFWQNANMKQVGDPTRCSIICGARKGDGKKRHPRPNPLLKIALKGPREVPTGSKSKHKKPPAKQQTVYKYDIPPSHYDEYIRMADALLNKGGISEVCLGQRVANGTRARIVKDTGETYIFTFLFPKENGK
jgi:CO dehydrogenase/acetyl-CoA synthase delta subunit